LLVNPIEPERSPLEAIRRLHLTALFAELRQVMESRRAQWRASPGLVLDPEALRRHREPLRHAAQSEPDPEQPRIVRPQRVNFCPVVKRMVRRRFPNWEFLANDGDRVVFENLVAMRLDLHLIFQLHEWQWRREGFSLKLGIQLGSEDSTPEVRMTQDVCALFGDGGQPLWPFVSLEQLEAALEIAGDQLEQVLAVFEELALKRLFPLPTTPPTLETRDISTAWTAWRHAKPLVSKWAAGAGLVFVQGPLRSDRPAANEPRPALPVLWNFSAEDPATGRRLEVTVPRQGLVTTLERPRPELGFESVLPVHVIDSDTALALANGALGTLAGEALQVGFGLMWAPSHSGFANPFWRLNYEFAAPPPLNSRQVTVDALQSRVLEVK
jgi:hypothetical protein